MSADDLIPLREVANMLPSNKPGKKVHLATLYRWIFKGRLPAVRRGSSYFVRREDLGLLYEPAEVQKRETARRRNAACPLIAAGEAALRRHGLANL